jgi:hypothetical protein
MRAHLPIALLEQPRHDGKRKIELAAAAAAPRAVSSPSRRTRRRRRARLRRALELGRWPTQLCSAPLARGAVASCLQRGTRATASQTRAATLPSPTMSRRRGPDARPSTIVPSAVRPTATTMASSDCSGARPHPPRLQPATSAIAVAASAAGDRPRRRRQDEPDGLTASKTTPTAVADSASSTARPVGQPATPTATPAVESNSASSDVRNARSTMWRLKRSPESQE